MKIRIITVLSILLFVFAISIPNNAFASGGTETITVQTNAICGSCKNRIETNLMQLKGVKFAELDLKTKQVTVKYKAAKVSADDIKQTITSVGYDADDIKANQGARKELPMCCQKEGMH